MRRALTIALCLSLPILRAAQAQPALFEDAGAFPLGVADTVFLSGNEPPGRTSSSTRCL